MLNSRSFFILTVVLAAFATPQRSLAELKANNESPTVTNDIEQVTIVNDDGSSKVHSQVVRTLLQESARQSFGVSQTQYDPQTDHVNIKAYVSAHGKTVAVPSGNIENKPIASDGFGFQSANQITVNFPDVEVGTQTLLITDGQFGQSTQGVTFFSDTDTFGSTELMMKGKLTYVSTAKLNTWVNDPDHVLKVTDTVGDFKDGNQVLKNKHILTIELLKPIFKGVKAENDVTVNGALFPWVDISNKPTWAEAQEVYAQKYEKIITSALPTGFESDYEKIKNLSSDDEKLVAVMAAVQARVVYFGDWRRIDGGMIPHTLADIEKAGKGDCKDMATSSVAIMRKLGYDAHVAIIERGLNPVVRPFPTSVVDHFNHAIVYVNLNGKSLWLDPTNQQSYLGINPDIMDRPAVVMIPGGHSFEAQTSLPDAAGNLMQVTKMVTPTSGSGVQVAAHIKVTGNLAVGFTTANLGTVKQNSDLYVLSLVADPSQAKNVQVGNYTLPDRIPHDEQFDVSFGLSQFFGRSTDGFTVSLTPPDNFAEISTINSSRATDLNLQLPSTMVLDTTIPNMSLRGQRQLTCSLDSRWISASRLVRQNKQQVEISNTYVAKTDRVAASDYNSAEFKDLQSKLNACFGPYSLILSPKKSTGWSLKSLLHGRP